MGMTDSTPATAAEHTCQNGCPRHGRVVCGCLRRCLACEPTTAAPYALPLDAYEAANLLHALTTHSCLNSGDWYLQVRERLRELTEDNVTGPNPLYCQRTGGH